MVRLLASPAVAIPNELNSEPERPRRVGSAGESCGAAASGGSYALVYVGNSNARLNAVPPTLVRLVGALVPTMGVGVVVG